MQNAECRMQNEKKRPRSAVLNAVKLCVSPDSESLKLGVFEAPGFGHAEVLGETYVVLYHNISRIYYSTERVNSFLSFRSGDQIGGI